MPRSGSARTSPRARTSSRSTITRPTRSSSGTRKRVEPQRVAGRGPLLTAFPPLIGTAPRILVLGSLPGAASLAAHEYYAHPRNVFWDFMGELFAARRELPYAERCALVTRAGVAVWDVLHQAHRPGSLDAAIVRDTLRPNDFASLFSAQPTLQTVAFNGGKAADLFRHHVQPALPPSLALRLHRLPSTSPANAGIDRATKLAAWRDALHGRPREPA